MSLESDYPQLAFLLGEVFESVGDIKLALKDGELEPKEIVRAIPDEGVRKYLLRLLTALEGLPKEVEKVTSGGPWKMMQLFQALSSKVTALFK